MSAQRDLPAESKAAAYEVEMLRGTALRLGLGPPAWPDTVVYNALVESFAVHARLLFDFFYTDPIPAPRVRPGDTRVFYPDIVAGDFVPDWPSIRGQPAPELRQWANVDANQTVAHLTTRRANLNCAGGPTHGWLYYRIAVRLREVLGRFLAQVEGKWDDRFDPEALQKLVEFARDRRFDPPGVWVAAGYEHLIPAERYPENFTARTSPCAFLR